MKKYYFFINIDIIYIRESEMAFKNLRAIIKKYIKSKKQKKKSYQMFTRYISDPIIIGNGGLSVTIVQNFITMLVKL